jgi:hypothetical protein
MFKTDVPVICLLTDNNEQQPSRSVEEFMETKEQKLQMFAIKWPSLEEFLKSLNRLTKTIKKYIFKPISLLRSFLVSR